MPSIQSPFLSVICTAFATARIYSTGNRLAKTLGISLPSGEITPSSETISQKIIPALESMGFGSIAEKISRENAWQDKFYGGLNTSQDLRPSKNLFEETKHSKAIARNIPFK